jgi:hypothetical protein
MKWVKTPFFEPGVRRIFSPLIKTPDMYTKTLAHLAVVFLLPIFAHAQVKPLVVNQAVADSAGQKASTKKPTATKPTAGSPTTGEKPTTFTETMNLAAPDSLFIALIRDILALRTKYTALQNSSETKKPTTTTKADTFGFLKLLANPPLTVGLYHNGSPYQDSSNVPHPKNNSPIDRRTLTAEAINKTITVDSVQLYMQSTYISRFVLFSGPNIYQSSQQVNFDSINKKATFVNFDVDSLAGVQIRINDLIVYRPWDDGQNKTVKEGIYMVTGINPVILPNQ